MDCPQPIQHIKLIIISEAKQEEMVIAHKHGSNEVRKNWAKSLLIFYHLFLKMGQRKSMS